jgi:hypothetical protein
MHTNHHNSEGDKEKPITFSPHAIDKMKRLTQVGINQEKAIETVRKPDRSTEGYLGRKIAQSSISDDLLLRVIYEETDNNILVVTLYPAKRERYE